MKKKLKRKFKPKKKAKKVVENESDGEESINKDLIDVEPALKEDLEILLDNFGHSLSEPILTGRTQEKASSVLEFSLRKVVYNSNNKNKAGNDFQVSTDPTSFTFPTTVNDDCDDAIINSSQCLCECMNIYHPSDSMCNCRNDDSFDTDLQSLLYKECSCMKCKSLECICQQQQQQQQQQQRQQQQQLQQQQQRYNKQYAEEVNDGMQYREEVRGLQKERINRYNLNHIQYTRPPSSPRNSKRWSWLSFFNNSKRNKKQRYKNNLKYAAGNRYDAEVSSTSGVTIPQLYKANVSNTIGITPGKFTFRAVTGSPQLFDITDKNYFKHYKDSTSHETMIYGNKVPNKNDEPSRSASPAGMRNEMKDVGYKIDKNDRNMINRNDVKMEKSKDSIDIHEYVVSRPPPERIDIYCFDHLNTGYFRTSDHPPPLISDIAMERVDAHATRFWAEIFGFIHLFTAFVIAFILQFYKFFLYGVIRPLMVGLVQLTSDYFIKPLLTIIYNGITQPLFIFFYNIATSFRDLCLPIAKGIGYFFGEIAAILKAIRLVDWKHTTVTTGSKHNAKNV